MQIIRSCALALSVLMLSLMMGCGGCQEEPHGPGNTTQDSTPDTPDLMEDVTPDIPMICTPNEMLGCRQENTQSINVCDPQGRAIVPGSCPDSQVCREDVCVPVICIPNARRCASPTLPQVCDEQGERYMDLPDETCREGERCEEGYCLNRCQNADRTGSYVGCEYWPTELENHLLDEKKKLQPAGRRPPFAIVLANTSTTYDAQITVYEAPTGEPEVEQIARAEVSRLVGTDVGMPGIDLVTVNSEVVNAQGQRIQRIDGPIDNITLPRGAIMTLIMPHREIPFGSSSLTRGAYRVVATQPVVAYQFNPLCCNYNFSNDASLLLPQGALTGNYMFMSFAAWAGGDAGRLARPYSPTLTVVGTRPDTQVTVQLRGSRTRPNRPFTELVYPSSNAAITGPDANGLISVTLQPFDVLNIAGRGTGPMEDMTGARVSASEPVAVYGGHTCAYVPFNNAACDHMESQLFPMETWGERFVLSPLKIRNPNPVGPSREGTYWKFVAREANTVITTGVSLVAGSRTSMGQASEGVAHCREFSTDPASGVFTLGVGQSCEFGSRQMLVAQSDKPIMVGAFLSSQQSVSATAMFGDHAGDPSFFLVPPEEQYRADYAFLTPGTYFQSYVMVTSLPGFPVMLDGQPINLEAFDYQELPGEGVVRAHIPVSPGPHNITSMVPFGIVVYGYDDYVSYAYTGGLNLTKLSELD